MATDLDTDRGIVRVPTGTWNVDPAHSSVEFRIKHMMISTVRGRVGEFEGTIEAAPDDRDSRRKGNFRVGGDRVGLEVRGPISRGEFGLRWQQPLETGGVLVGDEVRIVADIAAVCARPDTAGAAA